jgi:AIPR protein/Domain of unknown function (DUF4357)
MAPPPLSPAQSLQLRQLTHAIEARFVPSVHKKPGRHGVPPTQDQLRSRAFTAMAARVVSDIDDLDAARQVTDYYHDDDIDGFAIADSDTPTPTIYLIQAKWSANGGHNFKVHETTGLIRGFGKLIRDELHKDNLIQPYLPEIIRQINKIGSRTVLIFATSAANTVDVNTKTETLRDLRAHINDASRVSCRFLSLGDFSSEVQATPDRIHGANVSAPLESHKTIEGDPLSLQGIISAAEIGTWYATNPKRLFDDNVRLEKESDVNDEIVQCLLEEPQYFLHFNLGINALCESWGCGQMSIDPVTHEFKNLRIVNGAQTVYSIHKAMTINRESVEQAQVLIRFTRLDKAPLGFGARVARATNRSNPMSARDRVAMDYPQQRLRGEFTLNLGKEYAIRADDTAPIGVKGCSAQEAAIAMACGHYAATALMDVAKDTASLWAAQDDDYRTLFPLDVTAAEVWRRVQTLRLVTEALDQITATPTERSKSVAVRGRLIITHIVMRRLGDDRIDDIASDWDNHLATVPGHANTAVLDLSGSVRRRLTEKGLLDGKSLTHVTNVLRDSRWLAMEVERILAPGGSASPDRTVPWAPWPSEPEFRLPIGSVAAWGRRCDDGFLVNAGSMASLVDKSSLRTSELLIRQNLRDSLGLVPSGEYLRLTRDTLFESPSQAAAIMIGHSTNGPDYWIDPDGHSYNEWLTTR